MSAVVVLSTVALSIGCDDTGTSPGYHVASDVIPYENFAKAIDQGRIGEYRGKRLRIKGYVRAYLALAGKQILVIGEPIPSHEFPTMWCDVSPSDYDEALEFRGSKHPETDGLYDSAFPDRVVGVDALFTGRVGREGVDVYDAEDCTLMK